MNALLLREKKKKANIYKTKHFFFTYKEFQDKHSYENNAYKEHKFVQELESCVDFSRGKRKKAMLEKVWQGRVMG